MSRVVGANECRCDCHRNRGTKHVVACCSGQCRYCHKFINRGMMDKHVSEHEARYKELKEKDSSEI